MKSITVTKENRPEAMQAVSRVVFEHIRTGDVLIEIKRPSKKRDQEAKYHAMIGDIANSVTIDGRQWSQEVWKAKLIDDFEQERLAIGEPLSHPGQTTLSLDGRRAVTVRASSEKFRKDEASDFIEYLYMKGTEYGATFNDRALAIYEQEMKSRGIT